MSVKVTVDRTVNAAYIELSEETIVKTVELTGSIFLDLDEMGMVVGIEVLQIEADLPLQRLQDEYHVHSGVVDLLYKLRPSIGFQLSKFQQAGDGVSTRSTVEQASVVYGLRETIRQ